MSTRKFTLLSLPKLTLFYLPLIVIASVAVGMVIASRLDLAPASSAQTLAMPPMNSAPLTGPSSADTSRNIPQDQHPLAVPVVAPALPSHQQECRADHRQLAHLDTRVERHERREPFRSGKSKLPECSGEAHAVQQTAREYQDDSPPLQF